MELSDRPARLPLNVENFLLLNEHGAFADYSRTELIDGDIYVAGAHSLLHAHPKSQLLTELFNGLKDVGGSIAVIASVSVRLSDDSMPIPDIVLTDYEGDGPVPAETVALVIEVSDTTLDIDLGRKVELYGAAGIPEYWIVDLNEDRVLIHWHPQADGYREQLDVPFGEMLFSATIDGLSIESGNLVD